MTSGSNGSGVPSRWILFGAASLVVIAVLLSFHGLGRIALIDPDEPRYAEAARHMLASSDFVVPQFNGESRLQKPPLFYWAQALAFRWLGATEFAARLPSALACLALLALTVIFGGREIGWPAGLRAGAILITCPLTFVAGRAAITDMTLALLICSSLYVYYRIDRARIPATAGSLVVGILMGAAFLTKGPVGILAPAVVIAAYHLVLREPRRLLRWKGTLIALGTATAVSVPWVILAARRVGPDLLWDVALRETLERYLSSGLEHAHGAWFYFAAFGLGAFPWSIFLLPFVVGNSRRVLRGQDRLMLLLWVWMIAMILFFTVSRGKVATYILPVLPAAALFLAKSWESWDLPVAPGDTRRSDRLWKAAIAMFVPIAVLPFLVAIWVGRQGGEFFDRAYLFLVLMGTALLATLILSARGRRWILVPLLSVFVTIFYVGAFTLWAEDLERSKSLKGLIAAARIDERKPARLAVFRNDHPSLVFYSNRNVTRIETEAGLASFLLEPGDGIVVMNDWRLEALGPVWAGVLRTVATLDDHVALERAPAASRDAILSLPKEDEGNGAAPGR